MVRRIRHLVIERQLTIHPHHLAPVLRDLARLCAEPGLEPLLDARKRRCQEAGPNVLGLLLVAAERRHESQRIVRLARRIRKDLVRAARLLGVARDQLRLAAANDGQRRWRGQLGELRGRQVAGECADVFLAVL